MNATFILIIAGFTGLFTAIGLKNIDLLRNTPNVDPNHVLFSIEELTIGTTMLGIATATLVVLAIAVGLTNRR